MAYLPVVVYSLMGFELMSSLGDSIEDPKRDIPKMIYAGGAMILFLYMFATFGILAALPAGDIQIETGIVDALRPMFDSVLGAVAGPVFIIATLGLLFSFFGNMVTWSIGANESLAATGMDETAPGIFGHRHPKNDTPDYAFYLMGAIATVLTIATYGLFGNNDGIFWSIFTVSSVVFLLPYILMFPSLVVLRRKFPDQPRPYKVPLGDTGAMIWAVLCEIGILGTLALFFIAPPPDTPLVPFYIITVGGTVVSVIVGFWLYFQAKRKGAKGVASS
jgi:amino acid transporter